MGSRRKAILFFHLLTIAGMVLYFLVGGHSQNMFYVSCFVLGIGSGYWAVFATSAAEQFGTNIRATAATLAKGTATGFVFDAANGWALGQAIDGAMDLFKKPAAWRKVQRRGMLAEFSWEGPAQAYLDLYATIPAKGD